MLSNPISSSFLFYYSGCFFFFFSSLLNSVSYCYNKPRTRFNVPDRIQMPVTIANEGVVRIEAGGVVVINDDTTETEAPTNMHRGLQWSFDARKQV